MAQVFPTKANLMATQKSLDLAKLGYELMDRKRNILPNDAISQRL
jgi:V/A-type H+-transporting ATPase subunit D